MTDVVINRIQSIQRCIRRAREEYARGGEGFATDFSCQDAALLNVLRACETTIDLANHIVRSGRLGIPNSSGSSSRLLQAEGLIDDELGTSLTKMVGFRNIVVHQYGDTDIKIVESVITRELDHLLAFTDRVREYLQGLES